MVLFFAIGAPVPPYMYAESKALIIASPEIVTVLPLASVLPMPPYI